MNPYTPFQSGMSYRFKGGKGSKPPAPPAPQALPETADETGEQAAMREMRRGGFAKTVLTGALTPKSRKSTVLG